MLVQPLLKSFRRLLAVSLVALAPSLVSMAAEPAPGTGKPTNEKSNPPTYILLRDPSDLNRILNQIPPDSTIIQSPQRATAPRPPERGSLGTEGRDPWSQVINSVKISGQVADERADLLVDLEIVLREDGPVWIPLRLDGKALFSIKEGDRDVVRQCDDQKRWEVRLENKGTHHLRIELKVFLKSILDRSVLELDIPRTAWTSFDLILPQRISDVSTGTDEAIRQIALGPGKGYRVLADIAPRSRFSLSWRKDSGNEAERQPLISVQGEIALDLELESLRARASWSVRCVRGSAQILEVALDNEDQVLELQLDDQNVPYETERAGKSTLLKIPLPEPLTAASAPRRLVFVTRRQIPQGSSSVNFKGFSFSHAKEQVGAIALVPGVNLWPDYTLGQGILRINASEMPVELRSRPGTPLAFQFLDQPFELKLSVEPSPPLASAEARSMVKLLSTPTKQQPRIDVQLQTWIDIQWIRGRMFDIEIDIPDGLQLTSYGPPELIERSNFASGTNSVRIEAPAKRAGRVLKIRLSPLAMDQKKIMLRLEGQQSVLPSETMQVELFRPRNMIALASRFAVLGARGLLLESVESGPTSASKEGRPVTTNDDSASWPWQGVSPGTSRPSLLLRTQGLPESLPIRTTLAPRTIAHEVNLVAKLGAIAIEAQQQSVCEIRNGSARWIDLVVPASLVESWELVSPENPSLQELETKKDGSRSYRLNLTDPNVEKLLLRFRFQIPVGIDPATRNRIERGMPWIGIDGSTQKAVSIELTSDPGIQYESTSLAWLSSKEPRSAERNIAAQSRASLYRLKDPSQGIVPFSLSTWAVERVSLPRIVCPRSLIQSIHGYNDQVHHKAWFLLEGWSSHLSFELGAGARLARTTVDGHPVEADRVLSDETQSRYQLTAPASSNVEATLLLIEYDSGTDATSQVWQPPRLLDEISVLETFWEIKVPWNQALVGTPTGWSDENEWFWDRYLWRRRPADTNGGLLGWLGRPTNPALAPDESANEPEDENHGYLFSHSGNVDSISVRILSRSWLVGLCSGIVLLTGFAIIFSPNAYGKLIVWGALCGCAILSAIVHPSVIMLVAQCSIIGVVLSIMGFLIQRAIESRTPGNAAERVSVRTAAPITRGSTVSRPVEPTPPTVGSEESTAIRVRVASTMEYQTKESSGPDRPDVSPDSKVELSR